MYQIVYNVSNCQIDFTDTSYGNFSSDDDDQPVSPVFGKEKNSPDHEKQDESG